MLIPLDKRNWTPEKAAHLLNRAGFGATPEEIQKTYEAGFASAVDQVLNGKDDYSAFPPPAWAKPKNVYQERMDRMKAPDDATRKMMQKQRRREEQGNFRDLVYWWLNRMRYTSFPLREKMTLFWHGNFATSMVKVQNAYYMWLQNETFRRNALGNFRTMTKAISRDPAMMIWLDTSLNEQTHPNENFGRELMELFTLGIGNYTEDDIKAAARAFTGYRIDQVNGAFRYSPALHDNGEKTFLGKKANFDGDGIIDQIFAQPACATFTAKKLLRFFVYDNPRMEIIATVANHLRAANYEVAPVMREIFSSAEFYSSAATNSQIKSPVQLIVQAAKELEMELSRPDSVINALRQLGQMPFEPPNVKGWDGGKSWITTSTLLFRYNYANTMLSSKREFDDDMPLQFMNIAKEPAINFAKIAPPQLRHDTAALIKSLSWRLLQRTLPEKDNSQLMRFVALNHGVANDQVVHEIIHLIMSTPQYQLV